MKTLYIIDGYSLAYTSFFAGGYTGLSSPSGEPTYGTFIFTKTILRILNAYNPDMVCFAVDSPKNFRKEICKEYKNNRKKMPDDLFIQIDRMKEILNCFGFPIHIAPTYEADDVIATIVEKSSLDLLITICSKDKDLNQLIDKGGRINVLDPYKDERKYYEEVIERYGVKPPQFIDYQAFVGDTTDNISGVRGIGKKTTAKLLSKYGTGDKIFEELVKKEKLTKTELKFLEGYNDFLRSRMLATLRKDVPIEIDFNAMEVKEPNWDKLNPLFSSLGFNSLTKDKFGNRELA